MLLAQEFATGQSWMGFTPLDWKRDVRTLAFCWRDAIIEPVVVPYLQQHHVGIFQHDNGRPHTARQIMSILRINVKMLQWPARSPDLSPIEHFWDHLGRQVRETAMMSTTSVILNVPCKLNGSGSHCRSLENWFVAWDVIAWQSWLRMVGTLGIEPCPNFYAWPPCSFHVRRRLNHAGNTKIATCAVYRAVLHKSAVDRGIRFSTEQ